MGLFLKWDLLAGAFFWTATLKNNVHFSDKNFKNHKNLSENQIKKLEQAVQESKSTVENEQKSLQNPDFQTDEIIDCLKQLSERVKNLEDHNRNDANEKFSSMETESGWWRWVFFF